MNEVLIRIGLCSIVLLIVYIIKKVDEYFYFKKDENISYKFDKEDDEQFFTGH